MERAQSRTLAIPHVGLALYVGVNIGLFLFWRPWELVGSVDWSLWQTLPRAWADGTLYSQPHDPPYVYSPLAVPVFATIPYLGSAWIALHVGAVLLLRRRLATLTLLSVGFWFDAFVGNALVFIFVAGALALRGSRWAAIAYFALSLLMPRPLQVPLVLWLLWKQPGLRWPFAGMLAINIAGVVATGYAWEWFEAVRAFGIPDYSISLARMFPAWLVIGPLLAILLLWFGHVGWAGLAVSPYLWPGYLLWPLLDYKAGPPNANPTTEGRSCDRAAGAVTAPPTNLHS